MITFLLIQQIVCLGQWLPTETLQSKTRKREVVFARQLIMYFLVEHTKESWAQIAAHYGKDHATAMHAYKTINNLIDTDRKIKAKIILYNFQIEALVNFENNIVADKICEIKELLKMQIDGGFLISYETVAVYNKLLEKTLESDLSKS